MSENRQPSTHNRLSRILTADGNADPYDHEINLVDATLTNDEPSARRNQSDSSGWRQLGRHATHTSVKDHLARRKYAKWQQDQFDSKDGSTADLAGEEVTTEDSEQPKQQRGRVIGNAGPRDSTVVDFGQPPESPKASHEEPRKTHKHHHKRKERQKEESAIDILYENQRGSFFCGIPLYSHSSLLQFDPAPWVNKDYHASPVNITNAQVPDPSWQWVWKHWYVDMSEDVDEDGWQYSFAFFGNFSWHGTHPWFHSFCRRRRWLRKRTKVDQTAHGKPLASSMSAAHRLNTDYFTIHSKRDKSPSILESGPQLARPDSHASRLPDVAADEEPEEIDNIGSLMKALRIAMIDREKIELIKRFVELGGEELVYLKEKIPDIMDFLVFQNSKRQLLEFLRQKARQAQQHREEHDAEDRPEGEAESRRIDNLLEAVEAADEQIKGLEYWSDRKHVMVTTENTKSLTESPLVTIFDKTTHDPLPSSHDSVAGEIRGINADKAEIGNERIYETTYRGATLAPASDEDDKSKGKGKEKADDNENDPEDTERLPPRLEFDQVKIPAEDED